MKKFTLLTLVFLVMPMFVKAAAFDLVVNVGSSKLNAVEGTIVLPPDFVPQALYTGHSSILLWVTEPTFDQVEHTLSFAGITPGGFSGRQVLLTIEADKTPSIRGGSVVGYKNDGQGTSLQLEASLLETHLLEDLEAPEPFEVNISQSKEAFDGKHFLSFSAQDKNSGIHHYEFASTWFLNPSEGDWQKTLSPRVLSTQEMFKRVHVRAIDNRNNIRTVSTGGPYWYLTLAFGLIIIGCFAQFLKRSLSRFS